MHLISSVHFESTTGYRFHQRGASSDSVSDTPGEMCPVFMWMLYLVYGMKTASIRKLGGRIKKLHQQTEFLKPRREQDQKLRQERFFFLLRSGARMNISALFDSWLLVSMLSTRCRTNISRNKLVTNDATQISFKRLLNLTQISPTTHCMLIGLQFTSQAECDTFVFEDFRQNQEEINKYVRKGWKHCDSAWVAPLCVGSFFLLDQKDGHQLLHLN